MPAGRPKVDIEAKLNEIDRDFVDKVARSDIAELNQLLANVAKDEAYNQQAKEADLDLQQSKEEYEAKGADYKDATKANKLKTKLIVRVLGDKGGM